MNISCPHCKAAYEIGTPIKNAVLVCHRCHTEFRMDEGVVEHSEKNAARQQESSLPLFEHTDSQQRQAGSETGSATMEPSAQKRETSDIEEDSGIPVPAFLEGNDEYAEQIKRENMPIPDPAIVATGRERRKERLQTDEMSSVAANEPEESFNSQPESMVSVDETLPPARTDVVIWPWLIVILLVIGSVGFWYKKDAWLDQPWFRSVMINMHLPVEVRDKDWFIIPSSVQGHWLKRDDGSQVLVIQGRIENRLFCELQPPRILVRFFDDTGITDSLGEQLLPITEPPAVEQVKHAPFVTPPKDMVPVEAQGQRGFFLVVESPPERTADFTLSPVASR